MRKKMQNKFKCQKALCSLIGWLKFKISYHTSLDQPDWSGLVFSNFARLGILVFSRSWNSLFIEIQNYIRYKVSG